MEGPGCYCHFILSMLSSSMEDGISLGFMMFHTFCAPPRKVSFKLKSQCEEWDKDFDTLHHHSVKICSAEYLKCPFGRHVVVPRQDCPGHCERTGQRRSCAFASGRRLLAARVRPKALMGMSMDETGWHWWGDIVKTTWTNLNAFLKHGERTVKTTLSNHWHWGLQ